jgi:cytidylate kinase
MNRIITVDGPSGAGKGTLCRLLAKATGFALLDSGALYRLTALATLQRALEVTDEDAVAQVAATLDIAFISADSGVQVLLEGKDVSLDIRQEFVGMAASKIAALPLVRAALLERQRAFATAAGLVADGRDMGTVVFPQAPLKLFLTASAQVRAERRLLQLQASGETSDFGAILAAIEARDKQDSERASSPLVPAPDAILLDSTVLSIEQVFELALQAIKTNSSL